jgi:hypothetical protein
MTYPTTAARHPRRAFISSIAVLMFLGLTVAMIGCGGDSGDSTTTAPQPNKDPKGLYDLQTIDNAALPQEVYHGPYFDPATTRFYNQMVLLVKRGSVNLIEGNRWAMTLDIDQSLDDVRRGTTFYADGTYELNGTDIVLKPNTNNLTEIGGTLERGAISFSMTFNGSKREKAFNFKR